MAIIGNTGTGKTTLASRLLLCRRNTIAVRTKSDPAKLPGTLIRKTADIKYEHRYVLEPVGKKTPLRQTVAIQAPEVGRCIDLVWKQGAWSLYLDELFYVDNQLKLQADVNALLTQGRSKNITVIMGAQRPVRISRFALSEATHVLTFRQDGRDAKTLAEATTPDLAKKVMSLQRYHFVWYYRPEHQFWTGTLDLQTGELNGEYS